MATVYRGIAIAARIVTMATTISSSTSEKPELLDPLRLMILKGLLPMFTSTCYGLQQVPVQKLKTTALLAPQPVVLGLSTELRECDRELGGRGFLQQNVNDRSQIVLGVEDKTN